jgi:hypothetical protein
MSLVGQNSELESHPRRFRSNLINGHRQTGPTCPFRARSRLQRTYSIPSLIFHSTT